MADVHTDLGFPKITLKTPSLFKKSAPPTAKDGVPAKSANYFTHKFDNVNQYEHDWSYEERYGIFTQNGKKYYFEIVKGDKD